MKKFLFTLAALLALASCAQKKPSIPLYGWEGIGANPDLEEVRAKFQNYKAHGFTGVCIQADLADIPAISAIAHEEGLEYHAWKPCSRPRRGLCPAGLHPLRRRHPGPRPVGQVRPGLLRRPVSAGGLLLLRPLRERVQGTHRHRHPPGGGSAGRARMDGVPLREGHRAGVEGV